MKKIATQKVGGNIVAQNDAQDVVQNDAQNKVALAEFIKEKI
ncbi:hypothetical protein VYE96_01610 [Fusobacterium pseudoperiodonticum]|nr:hypothetical protein [Fusobacterium pseudoperiodonticum]